MVRGKPSNWSARQMDIYPHSLVEIGSYIMLRNNYRCREERFSVVGESGPDPRTGMRRQRLLGSDLTVLQACVLGLPLQGWKFDLESSVSRGYWDCLIPLPHRVKSETFMIINLVGCKYIFYHVCVDRCLPRMVNETKIWKLKLESKDLLFVAFQQKKPQNLHKLCMSS